MRSKWVVLGLVILFLFAVHFEVSAFSFAGDGLRRELKIGYTVYAELSVAHMFGALLTILPGGLLADRYGARNVLVLSVLVGAIAIGATGWVANVAQVGALRVAVGMGMGLADGAIYKLIRDNVESKGRPAVLTLLFFTTTLPYSVDARFGFALADHSPWRGWFFASAAFDTAVAILLFWVLRGNGNRESLEPTSEASGVVRKKPSWLFAAVAMMLSGSALALIHIGIQYLYSKRIATPGNIGDLPYLTAIGGILAIGYLANGVFNQRRELLAGICCAFAGGAILIGLVSHRVDITVLALGAGLFLLNGAYVPFWIELLDASPPKTCGRVFATVSFWSLAGFLGLMMASGATGAAIGDVRSGLLMCAGAAAIAAVGMVVLDNRSMALRSSIADSDVAS